MKWKVFYNSSCALQNYENLLVTASKDEGAALEFCECTEVSELERGSLYLDEQGELMFIGAPLENPIRFSWEQSLHFWSKEKMSFKKHPLLRALGAPAGQWVVDATCGMAGDTTFLLNAGLNVRAFERFFHKSPITFTKSPQNLPSAFLLRKYFSQLGEHLPGELS